MHCASRGKMMTGIGWNFTRRLIPFIPRAKNASLSCMLRRYFHFLRTLVALGVKSPRCRKPSSQRCRLLPYYFGPCFLFFLVVLLYYVLPYLARKDTYHFLSLITNNTPVTTKMSHWTKCIFCQLTDFLPKFQDLQRKDFYRSLKISPKYF